MVHLRAFGYSLYQIGPSSETDEEVGRKYENELLGYYADPPEIAKNLLSCWTDGLASDARRPSDPQPSCGEHLDDAPRNRQPGACFWHCYDHWKSCPLIPADPQCAV